MMKIIKISVACCVVVAILICIYLSCFQKTLDFRGTVDKIENAGNSTVFYISMPSIGSSYTVVADSRTRISYCHRDDPKITLDGIEVGDEIEGDFRVSSKDNVAKFITVEYHN